MNDIMGPHEDLIRPELACGSSSKYNMTKCNSLRSKSKADSQPGSKAVTSVTKRMCDCIVSPGATLLNCHPSNLVYLITCDLCDLQFVSETV